MQDNKINILFFDWLEINFKQKGFNYPFNSTNPVTTRNKTKT